MAKKQKWVKIADDKLRHVWVCDEGKCKAVVAPSWYTNNGTPQCTNEDCPDFERDMSYSHTEIRK